MILRISNWISKILRDTARKLELLAYRLDKWSGTRNYQAIKANFSKFKVVRDADIVMESCELNEELQVRDKLRNYVEGTPYSTQWYPTCK
jgi:hypothetical protein